MTIHLPEHLEQFVHDQVQAGRYPTEDEVIQDALEQLRKHAQPISNAQGSLGAMRDAADELDEVVAHAMELRKSSPGERCPVNKALLDTDIYSEVLKAKNPTVSHTRGIHHWIFTKNLCAPSDLFSPGTSTVKLPGCSGHRHDSLPRLRIAVLCPGPRTNLWVYATVGASEAKSEPADGLEFFMTVPAENLRHVELLTLTACSTTPMVSALGNTFPTTSAAVAIRLGVRCPC